MSELTKIEQFLASQTNQAVVITAFSAIVAAVTQMLGHSESLSAGSAAIAGTLAGLVWPAKPALKAAVVSLVGDAVEAAITKNTAGIAQVLTDGGAVVTASKTDPVPVTPGTAATSTK